MPTPRHPSVVSHALLALLLLGGTGADAASLKTCKQICGQSVQLECVGLRKGKLRKCKKRLWKACKRGETDCVVVTSTTATTSTTLATLPLTSSTVVTTTTTTTTLRDDIVFRGMWDVHPTIASDGCSLGATDDILEIHGTAEEATATLDVAPIGAPLTGQIDDTGNLLLGIDIPGEGECVTELRIRLVGPIELSDEATTGDASITNRGCGDADCQTLYNVSFAR